MDILVRMACIVFLLFGLGIAAVSCRSHTLLYHITVVSAPTPGVPQYSIIMYVDGAQYGRYNSDIRQAQFFSPSLSPLSEHLEMQTRYAQAFEVWQRHRLNFLMGVFNKTKGGDRDTHIYQRKAACELRDDGTSGGYQEIAFDGKEFLAYDKEKVVYIPSTQEAVMVSHLWNKHYSSTNSKMFMEIDCIQHMKMYLPYISTDLEKKVPPKVKVSSSESESGTKLHCRVYGFYPRDVEVKWIKNGRDEIHSEEAAQILPNPDGTYQIRVSVGVTPEGGATYSCHIDHSSLEKAITVPFEPNKRSILYIIPVILASLVLLIALIALGVFICRKKKDPSGSHQRVSAEDKE
ncbi:major histocompatibility complex class I-related gene protein-like [Xenopus tropicalis]|uniref:Major histocompatibility complex class I-related gene protein-like n=1 Tax=Xenopus tropicalis TaxID=8364 RepID=A0A8J0QHA2_XENTR|nr:major histocompatibility complex, class 1, UB alpha chain, subfamily 13, member 1 [Xenopus tropicalis]|eukprot:XP_004918998.1 PREDICTED: major histocompatibility complex class I-related gene protein-like isoform X1 [Xenopus tropicalis]